MRFLEKLQNIRLVCDLYRQISPKRKPSTKNIEIDLTSPAEAEDETMEYDDIFCVNTKDIEKEQEQVEKQHNNEEKHGTIDDNIENNTAETGGEKWITRTNSPTGS